LKCPRQSRFAVLRGLVVGELPQLLDPSAQGTLLVGIEPASADAAVDLERWLAVVVDLLDLDLDRRVLGASP
jgi:hypothetical protein